VTNIHSWGAALQNKMRPAVADHPGYLRRGTATDGNITEIIHASSPPIGQRIVTDTGLDLSEHDRVLFFAKNELRSFGLPRKGDVWVEQCDGSEWRVLPDGNNQYWRYHGQTRDMIQLHLKADTING
jgi:hypothetical protein